MAVDGARVPIVRAAPRRQLQLTSPEFTTSGEGYMLLTDLEPQLVRRPPAVPACRGHEPASTERWAHGASNSLASRLCHTLLAAVRRHSSVQEANSQATVLALQLSELGR